jgi:hypothetical protein
MMRTLARAPSGAELMIDDTVPRLQIVVSGRVVDVYADEVANVAVLPFLEMDVAELEKAIAEREVAGGTVEFPYELFVKAGFKHGSPHWVACAMTWLAGLPKSTAGDFVEDLRLVERNTKRYSQAVRHLARKLMRGQERPREDCQV